MKVFAKKDTILASNQKVFDLVSNCNHFGRFLPEQVKDWESTENYCKFSIQGVATLTLTIAEKIVGEKVLYRADNDKNIPVFITFLITEIEASKSALTVEAELDVPIFLSAMVKNPLQNLVEMIATKVQQVAENQ